MTTTAGVRRRTGRWRTARWVALALVVVVAVSALTAYLTAPRPGARMGADSTSPDGARALVTLLRDRGVDVIEAKTLGDVERAARPGTLLVLAETSFLVDDDGLRRLAAVPGDRLLVEPVSRTLEALAPRVEVAPEASFGGAPGCALPAAQRAGDVQLGTSNTYRAVGDADVTRCYGGAVVQLRGDDHTTTVVGTADFMTNSGLPKQGNAALAMNLAGSSDRVVWYVPTFVEGESDAGASITDLVPDWVGWALLQAVVAVLLTALWRARRLGPLVAEDLPVVVRASETVEGRGRLYRSRRARDRAAGALRTGALQRMLPRLGLRRGAPPTVVAAAVAHRIGGDPAAHGHWLFGPAPATDADLVTLARQLDDIERQVSQS